MIPILIILIIAYWLVKLGVFDCDPTDGPYDDPNPGA